MERGPASGLPALAYATVFPQAIGLLPQPGITSADARSGNDYQYRSPRQEQRSIFCASGIHSILSPRASSIWSPQHQHLPRSWRWGRRARRHTEKDPFLTSRMGVSFVVKACRATNFLVLQSHLHAKTLCGPLRSRGAPATAPTSTLRLMHLDWETPTSPAFRATVTEAKA